MVVQILIFNLLFIVSLLPVGTEEAVAMITRISPAFNPTLFGSVARC